MNLTSRGIGGVSVYFKKGHKYGAKKTKRKTDRAGYSFASKAEASLFDWLKLREKNGEIQNLKTQVSVYLTKARIQYKPDFSFEEEKEIVFAEMKGYETPVWRIKRRLWLAGYGPGKLQVWRMSNNGPFLQEEINPKEFIKE